jgi:hypothetical protein
MVAFSFPDGLKVRNKGCSEFRPRRAMEMETDTETKLVIMDNETIKS